MLNHLLPLVQKEFGQKSIRAYRGGYLPNERREIEKGLRRGEIKGVISTNALELGVDIGSLQVCIMCGYPNSIYHALKNNIDQKIRPDPLPHPEKYVPFENFQKSILKSKKKKQVK